LFSSVRDAACHKLVVVEGDIENANDLGITDDNIYVTAEDSATSEQSQVVAGDSERSRTSGRKRRFLDSVSVVFHLAATVSFNEPLRLARYFVFVVFPG